MSGQTKINAKAQGDGLQGAASLNAAFVAASVPVAPVETALRKEDLCMREHSNQPDLLPADSKGPANTRGPALAQSRRYAVAVGGSQMCGSSWSMSRALWVGSRVSTSFRYA